MRLLTRDFRNSWRLNCFIDKTVNRNYRDVHAKNAGGLEIPIHFAQKSRRTVITHYHFAHWHISDIELLISRVSLEAFKCTSRAIIRTIFSPGRPRRTEVKVFIENCFITHCDSAVSLSVSIRLIRSVS